VYSKKQPPKYEFSNRSSQLKRQSFSLILDFDSTFITGETLDELAVISLVGHNRRDEIIDDIRKITELGMAGKISFTDSLKRRLNQLSATNDHLKQLSKNLKGQITASIERNQDFFIANQSRIYIVSGGFKDVIRSVTNDFKIREDHIFANDVLFDEQSNLVGIDLNNPLSRDHGKSQVIKKSNIPHPILMFGDGYTDLEVKKDGAADYFFAFTENVNRPEVTCEADRVISSFDEFIEMYQKGNLFDFQLITDKS